MANVTGSRYEQVSMKKRIPQILSRYMDADGDIRAQILERWHAVFDYHSISPSDPLFTNRLVLALVEEKFPKFCLKAHRGPDPRELVPDPGAWRAFVENILEGLTPEQADLADYAIKIRKWHEDHGKKLKKKSICDAASKIKGRWFDINPETLRAKLDASRPARRKARARKREKSRSYDEVMAFLNELQQSLTVDGELDE